MAGLRSVVAQGPPPLPKMNPWKQAGELATGMFLGRGAAEAIWHPKYNRQVEEYGRTVGQAKAMSDIDVAIQNQQQTIAKTEAQIGADNATADRNRRQGSLYDQQSRESEAKIGREDEKAAQASPEAVQSQRRKLAQEIGFQPGTPEFNELMVDGKYTDPATKRKVSVRFETDEINGNVTAIKYDEAGNPVGTVDVYKGIARNRPPVGPQPPSLQNQTHYTQNADKTYSKWTVFTDPKTGQEVSRREERGVTPPNQGGGFFAGVSPATEPAPLDKVKPQVSQPAAPAAVSVKLLNPKTGQVRAFTLSPEDLADAKRQGFQEVK